MTEIMPYIALLIVLNVVVFLCSVLAWENFSFVNPIVIYKNVKMNWVGVFLLTIILNALLPSVSICYWIYKLLTVGRKDEE